MTGSTRNKAYITSLGHYNPSNNIPNSIFEKLDIDTNDEWIVDRTGIESRCSVLTEKQILDLRYGKTSVQHIKESEGLETVEHMSQKAWGMCTERLGEDKAKDLDVVQCGLSMPDWLIPANACVIANKIGAQCPSYDINSACSSFVVNLHAARSQIQSGLASRIGIFTPERYTLGLDFSDRSSCILFGDGAACAIVESSPDSSGAGFEVVDTLIESDPSGYDLVKMPMYGSFSQKGSAVQKFAVSKTVEISEAILARNQLTKEDLDFFVGHQANLRMLKSAAKRLGVEEAGHFYNVDRYGNQGAAGAPSALSANWARDFSKDSLLLMTVVGSGLTWASALLRKC